MMPCDRSAVITAMLGKAAACPNDAQAVIIRKARGDVRATLCTAHVRAYRSAGIDIEEGSK